MCEQLIEDIIETVSMIAGSEEQFEENKRMTEGNQEESKNPENRMIRRRRVKKNAQGDMEYMDYLMTAMENRHHEILSGAKSATDIRQSVKLQYRHFFEENNKDGGKNLEAFEITPTLGVHG